MRGWLGLHAMLYAGVALAQTGPAAWTNDAEPAATHRDHSLPPSPYARPNTLRPEGPVPNAAHTVQPTYYAEPLTAAAAPAMPEPTSGAPTMKPPGEPAKPAAAIPLARRQCDPPVPLAAHGDGKGTGDSRGGLASLGTLAGSLVIVLTLFFLVMWLMRRAAPQAGQILPGEVVEVLGRAPLTGRQQMHLLRCGRKLLLVSVTPEGAKTLTEITDPEEVDRLAGLCQQTRPGSATAAFRQVFQQFAGGGKL